MSDAIILDSIRAVAREYQQMAITKLDRKIPPDLIGMIWTTSAVAQVNALDARQKIDRDQILRIQSKTAEDFLIFGLAGFGSMGEAEIEEGKRAFDRFWQESRSMLEFATARGPMQGLREWADDSDVGKEQLLEAPSGPVALVTLLGCLVASIRAGQAL